MCTISVTGKGSIHVVPDVTRLETTVSGWFKTYEEAYAQARENASWFVKILEYNNKSGKLAKTVHFDISDHEQKKYDSSGKFIDYIKNGYDLEQRVKIDLGIDNKLVNNIVRGIGKFIKGAQVNIGYTVQDPRPHQLKMIARAVTDARDKAKKMAEALDCQIGNVESVRYSECGVSVYSQARNIHSNKEAMTSTPDSLDITPDDLVMSDTVDVEFELINPKKEKSNMSQKTEY